MKVLAILNPENGTCRESLSQLYRLSQSGYEIEKVYLALENTYSAEKWVISLSMPLFKEEIEDIKKRYTEKVLSEWEAISGNTNLPIVAEVAKTRDLLKDSKVEEIDLFLIGCLESKSLCKLIGNLNKPILVVKN